MTAKPHTAIIASAILAASSHAYSANKLEEVTVTADFRDSDLYALSSSISVINADTIAARSAQHIEQLLNLTPNVNFSAGASRGRFFQIRGIGERSQFVDPINPSVGLVIDGIDFTGLGLAASTLDIKQVEVLRGPQGTLNGANALAGLINMSSNDPSAEVSGLIAADIADYDSRTVKAVISGPISANVGYRLAAQSQTSDGYIDNTFLNRDDTNNIDEQFVRGKLVADISDTLQLSFNGFYVNADNGYDAFSLNNNRRTSSDQPGHDRQESFAAGVTLRWAGAEAFVLESVVSTIDADTEYGFDEDWSFVGEFDPNLFPYSSADNFDRSRTNNSLDLRLLSQDGHEIFNGSSAWTIGLYHRTEKEQLRRTRFADLAFDSLFTNRYETETYAIYGQLNTALGGNWSLSTGLRAERRDTDYRDSANVSQAVDETLVGGNIGLEYQLSDTTLLYGLVSRGYKAGGVNGQIISAAQANASITPDVFFFDTETQWNYELGIKGNWPQHGLRLQLAAFYQDRADVQAKQSIFNPANFSFDDFLSNANGNSRGLEFEFNYNAGDAVDIYGSLGLLQAEFDGFVSKAHVDARDDFAGLPLAPVNLDGRDVAHAPNYQFVVGTEIRLSEAVYLRLETEGKDEYFFSNSHDKKSTRYELIHARIGYRAAHWELALWGRNLGDEDVATRGFFFSNQFGNNPANGYAPELFEQLGEPRVIGASGTYRF